MCLIPTVISSVKVQNLEIFLWVFRVLGPPAPKRQLLSTYLGVGRSPTDTGVGGGGPPTP